MDNNLEELKVLQTIVILATATDTVIGKFLTQVSPLQLCVYRYALIHVHLYL